MKPYVYGIGNPLIDIFAPVSDEDLFELGLHKGTMHLIDADRRAELLAFIAGREISYGCGGSCPNTIITLASFGIPSVAAGMVGDDEYGSLYKARLQELSVRDQLSVCGKPTGSSIILISPDSERTMNTFLGANRAFGSQHVDREILAEAGIFHFTGYMWDTESQKQSILTGITAAKEHGTLVSFDIADPFSVSRNRQTFLKLIDEHVDIVFANNEEARILFDNYDAGECAKAMGKICRTAIVKNGKHGSYASHEGELFRIPVKGKEPVDTTGAGDIYAAGFLLGVCRNFTTFESGLLASFLAGEIISQQGAQFSSESAAALAKKIDAGDWSSL